MTLADIATRAARLCDDLAVAHETALRCASQGHDAGASRLEWREGCAALAKALEAIADHDDTKETAAGVWLVRSYLAEERIVYAEAWGVELTRLAAEVGAGGQ